MTGLSLLYLGGGIQFKPLRIKEAAIGALILLTQAFLRALKPASLSIDWNPVQHLGIQDSRLGGVVCF